MERVKTQISGLSLAVSINNNSLEKGRKGLGYETVNGRFCGGGGINAFNGWDKLCG